MSSRQRRQNAFPNDAVAEVIAEADAAHWQLEMDRDDSIESMRRH
jgi:hypothetical protein